MTGLYQFVISSKYDNRQVIITAKNREQAWAKFVTQRFGPLKPLRNDWRIRIHEHHSSSER